MAFDNQPDPNRRAKGRPLAPVPAGRDLVAEVAHLKAWLLERPGIKPASISKAAGLHAVALGNMLREFRRPQAAALNAIYQALTAYNYEPLPNSSINKQANYQAIKH